MLLAADIGGTHARVGLFTDTDTPRAVSLRQYPTPTLGSFADLLARFTEDEGGRVPIAAAAIGIAGPVHAGEARLTNGTWGTSVDAVGLACGTTRVRLINDLAALGWSTLSLEASACVTLQTGTPETDGPVGVIAPGTGLGEALVMRSGDTIMVMPTESGHADFAARSAREWTLAAGLLAHRGRATVEDVLSGPGLRTIAALTHGDRPCAATSPEAITQAGLTYACAACADALGIFAAALGAEAGNLALRTLATGGVFIGGSLANALLPLLHSPLFLDGFRTKAPMADLVSRIPVYVIKDPQAGLLGAAVAARRTP